MNRASLAVAFSYPSKRLRCVCRVGEDRAMTELTAADGRWRNLAERLLQHPHPGMLPTGVEVFLERLPDDVAPDLPLPHGGRLLGSARRTQSVDRLPHLEAVMDVDGGPAAIVSAYESQLVAQGWSRFDTPSPPRGLFQAVEGASQTFRRPGEGPVLTVGAFSRDTGPCDVRIQLDWDLPRHLGRPQRSGSPAMERMPSLRPPAGVMISGGGFGGSSEGWTAHATARTDLSVSDLESHLSAQLTDAGWSRLGGSVDEVVGWSSWRAPEGDAWTGLLLVLRPLGPGQLTLMFRLEEQDESDGVRSSAAPT